MSKYTVFKNEGSALVKAWIDGVEYEDSARVQVEAMASLPFIHPYIAILPDVHMGFGATVGSVIPTRGAIVPSAVGVDIGCGMMAIRLPLRANELGDLHALRSEIEAAVPHGRTDGGGKNDRGAWGDAPAVVLDNYATRSSLANRYHNLTCDYPTLHHRGVVTQLGTLGTGNHFIELCVEEGAEPHVWVMLHSGSRGVGNAIGSFFIEKAKRNMEKYFINLPNRDLAYIPEDTEEFNGYVRAVEWAQDYARANRQIMMTLVLGVLAKRFPQVSASLADYPAAVNVHHNYVARENHFGQNVWVTRKGAVRARLGEMGIIPGSMNTGSFIVRGKGNLDSLQSCSHGAGRKMSRTEARRRFTVEDVITQTAGNECRKDEGIIDELPQAYKSLNAVMEAQSDLVEIVYSLRALVTVKG